MPKTPKKPSSDAIPTPPASGAEVQEDGTITTEALNRGTEALRVIEALDEEEIVKEHLRTMAMMTASQKDAYLKDLGSKDEELACLVDIALLGMKIHRTNEDINADYNAANVRAIGSIQKLLDKLEKDKNDA